MNIEIIPYQEIHLPEMIAIWNEVVNDGLAFPQEEPLSLESGREFFASQTYCGVAREPSTGNILGLYILHPNNIGRCGHLCNASYAVKKNCRGSGVGKQLVEDSLAKAKLKGFGIMQFNAVTADNDYANTLYARLGFSLLGTIPSGFRRTGNKYADINLYYKPL